MMLAHGVFLSIFLKYDNCNVSHMVTHDGVHGSRIEIVLK